jgi:hypothetical protein
MNTTWCTITMQQQHHSDAAFLDNILPSLIPYDDDDLASNRSMSEDEEEEDDGRAVLVPSFPVIQRFLQVLLKVQKRPTSSSRAGTLDFIVHNDNAMSHGRARIAVVSAFDCFSLSLAEPELSSSSLSANTTKRSSRYSLLRKAHSEPLLLCSSQERWMSTTTSTKLQDCAPTIPARSRHHHHFLSYMKKANSEPTLLPSSSSSSSQHGSSMCWQSISDHQEPPSPQTHSGAMDYSLAINIDDKSSASDDSRIGGQKNMTTSSPRGNTKKKKNNSNSNTTKTKRAHDYAPKIPQRCRSIIFTL